VKNINTFNTRFTIARKRKIISRSAFNIRKKRSPNVEVFQRITK